MTRSSSRASNVATADLPDPGIPSPFPSDAELKRAQRNLLGAGGRLIPGPHRPNGIVKYEASPNKIAFLGKIAPPVTVTLTSCGHRAGVEIPYDDHRGRHQKTVACLICDTLYMSPKFNGVEFP